MHIFLSLKSWSFSMFSRQERKQTKYSPDFTCCFTSSISSVLYFKSFTLRVASFGKKYMPGFYKTYNIISFYFNCT